MFGVILGCLGLVQAGGSPGEEEEDGESEDDDDDGDDDGYPAYSHHDKIPPWWGNVSNDKGGKMSVTKSHHT